MGDDASMKASYYGLKLKRLSTTQIAMLMTVTPLPWTPRLTTNCQHWLMKTLPREVQPTKAVTKTNCHRWRTIGHRPCHSTPVMTELMFSLCPRQQSTWMTYWWLVPVPARCLRGSPNLRSCDTGTPSWWVTAECYKFTEHKSCSLRSMLQMEQRMTAATYSHSFQYKWWPRWRDTEQ